MSELDLNNFIEKELDSGSSFQDVTKDLFKATDQDIDLKTDLLWEEILVLSGMYEIHRIISKHPIGCTFYGDFIEKYIRMKVSKDRLSRGEFVEVNRKDHFDRNMRRFADMKNILEARK